MKRNLNNDNDDPTDDHYYFNAIYTTVSDDGENELEMTDPTMADPEVNYGEASNCHVNKLYNL